MSRTRERSRSVNLLLLSLGLFLLSFSILTTAPQRFALSTERFLAASTVSLGAGVGSTPENTLMSQLQQRAQELGDREAQFDARQQGGFPQRLGMYSFYISMLVLVLVAVNFYFDMRRRSPMQRADRLSVDLR